MPALETIAFFQGAAMSIVAVLFVLFSRAIRERRGDRWAPAWAAFAAAAFLGAAAAHDPRYAAQLGLLALATYTFAGACAIAAGKVSRFAWIAYAAAGAAAAAMFFWQPASRLTAPPAFVLACAMAIVALRARVRPRGLGRAIVFWASAALSLLFARDAAAALVLAVRARALSPEYWAADAAVATILETVLAIGTMIALMDVTRAELEAARRRLELAAKVDPLTQLFNRYAFSCLLAEFKRRREAGACLVLVDVDDLKTINDRDGHSAGDRALCSVADRLRRIVYDGDYLFRWGGDEFVLVFFGYPLDFVRERVRTLLDGTADGTSVSWGAAPFDPADVRAAFDAADRELYARKRSGCAPGLRALP